MKNKKIKSNKNKNLKGMLPHFTGDPKLGTQQ